PTTEFRLLSLLALDLDGCETYGSGKPFGTGVAPCAGNSQERGGLMAPRAALVMILLFLAQLLPLSPARADGFDMNDVRATSFEPTAPVPEPATMLVVGAGLIGVASRLKRRGPASPRM